MSICVCAKLSTRWFYETRIRNNLDGEIEKTLRVSYDRLDRKDQDVFLYIAISYLFNMNMKQVSYIQNLLGDDVDDIRLTRLADKSLIRITPYKSVEMHNLLQKLGIEIIRAESSSNPGKRRFLVDVEDIRDVLTDHTGTDTVLGIYFNTSDMKEPFVIDEKSFKNMCNLQFLNVYDFRWRPNGEGRLHLPQGLVYLPRKLRLLKWDACPLKCLPSNFKAECLVELIMENSKLEKLWEGTQQLRWLKKISMSWSRYLKEIPDLSKAINLEEVYLDGCTSLVTLPSTIQNVIKLRRLNMAKCTKLERLPTHLYLESLEYLDFSSCSMLRNFPRIRMYGWRPLPHESVIHDPKKMEFSIAVEDCFWNKNLSGLNYLDCLMKCMPSKFCKEHLVSLIVRGNMLEKLWEGVQSLGSLQVMDLSGCVNLTEIPDLSNATNLEYLILNYCKSLVTIPSTVGNLSKLVKLKMIGCTSLEVLPTDVNLSSLQTLNLRGCSSLRSFPQISRSIQKLSLCETAIEQVPCCIEKFLRLIELRMRGCKRLKKISPNIFRLTRLERADFSDCGGVTALSDDTSAMAITEDYLSSGKVLSRGTGYDVEINYFMFHRCFSLDEAAQELILRSYFEPTVLPGKEVPTYFTYQASGASLTVTLPQGSLSQDFLLFKACVVVAPPNECADLVDPTYISFFLELSLYIGGVSISDSINQCTLELCEKDQLVLGSFVFRLEDLRSKLDDNVLEFEFSCDKDNEASVLHKIKGCGIRVLNVSPSPDRSDGSSETGCNQQSGEKCDVLETGRGKKEMRMTLGSSEESFNLLCQVVADTRLTAPNLELSLGQGDDFAQVSSRSKIPSSSVSSSNFHGDEASLCLSLSPSYLCLEGDVLCVDPMITEQQDTKTPTVDPSSSTELINFLR